MNNIVIGILGTRLDCVGWGDKRWKRWRPTLSIVQQTDFTVKTLILIYRADAQKLANLTIKDIELVSPETTVISYLVDFEDPWDFETVYAALLDMSKKIKFNTEKNQYYIHISTGTHVAQICLYLLTEAHFLPAKLLQTMPSKEGKKSYQIIDLDLSCYDQIAARFKQDARIGVSYLKNGIKTKNKAFNQLIEQLEKVSIHSTEPILLTGETGTGKSRLAKRIYQLKKQRHQLDGVLVEVNCATLRGDNAMSTLFGHCKGAFTGAIQARSGLLRQADGGLLFLDEIGELGLDEQAMLLHAIEHKVFMPFGSDKPISSHFQLITGTNMNLFEAVQQGRFRKDLLARINLWQYHLPSLRDRIEDLLPNIDYELMRYAQKNQMNIRFNQAAKAAYLDFSYSKAALWTANFRDLHASIIRMSTLSEGGRINEAIVQIEIKRLKNDWQFDQPVSKNQLSLIPPHLKLDLFEQIQLNQVIEICQQSESLAEAGRTLFNISRLSKAKNNDSHRLRQYLKKYHLDFKKLKN